MIEEVTAYMDSYGTLHARKENAEIKELEREIIDVWFKDKKEDHMFASPSVNYILRVLKNMGKLKE